MQNKERYAGKKIAVYARKSKLTETGKSIENQITRCRSCAAFRFDAGDGDIVVYTDEGRSGFYGDRPGYLHMLRDIAAGKIFAVICYKFDRISRRTVDLLRLAESLNTRKIDFISCSDEIDTTTKSGRAMISFLATIAEFERDIIAERISDNLYELAKDGRWLGGNPPTGYCSKKEVLYTGGRKNSIHHLEPVGHEMALVKELYRLFLLNRSLTQTCEVLSRQGYRTKTGREFGPAAVKAILQNPVYAAADAEMYAYFAALRIPVYKDRSCFDGACGLMVYNKTDQQKTPAGGQAGLDAKYVKKKLNKDPREWVASVGRHPAAVTGKAWLEVRTILAANADKYRRPKVRTQALLSGVLLCPVCGSRMAVHPDSGRFTAGGEPRFHYVCRQKLRSHGACPDSKNQQGNDLDRLVLLAVCSLPGPDEFYDAALLDGAAQPPDADGQERALTGMQKELGQLEKSIRAQAENLRDAPESAKPALYADIAALAEEREKKNAALAALQEAQRQTGNHPADIEKARILIHDFAALMNAAAYGERLAMIHQVIEKVVVLGEEVHIYFK